MALLDRVAVWQRADGGISITYVDDADRGEGESDDDLFNRMVAKHGQSGLLVGLTPTIIARDKIKPHSKDTRGLINGEVVDDPVKVQVKRDAKSEKESKQDAALSKLKITKAELQGLLGDL